MKIFQVAKLVKAYKTRLNVKEQEKNKKRNHKINVLHAVKRQEC
jgi:hypothetical protein